MKFDSSVTTESWIDVFESQDDSSKERRLVFPKKPDQPLYCAYLNIRFHCLRVDGNFYENAREGANLFAPAHLHEYAFFLNVLMQTER